MTKEGVKRRQRLKASGTRAKAAEAGTLLCRRPRSGLLGAHDCSILLRSDQIIPLRGSPFLVAFFVLGDNQCHWGYLVLGPGTIVTLAVGYSKCDSCTLLQILSFKVVSSYLLNQSCSDVIDSLSINYHGRPFIVL